MNIVLFGAPGSGKGSQSELLVSRRKMTQVSTGDLFRSAIKNKSQLGILAQGYMDKGQLVPDQIVIGMVEEVIKSGVVNFILDGFPRTITQADSLVIMLEKYSLKVDKVIYLKVSDTELLRRLSGRRVCKNCGAVYHIDNKPTKVIGICDKCNGEVYQRSDDTEASISVRLEAYSNSTMPLIDYYKTKGSLLEIDGNGQVEEIYERIVNVIS